MIRKAPPKTFNDRKESQSSWRNHTLNQSLMAIVEEFSYWEKLTKIVAQIFIHFPIEKSSQIGKQRPMGNWNVA